MSTDSSEVKLHLLDYWRVLRVRLPMILLVFLLVLITSAVVTYLMPKQYQSSVRMQIKQNDTALQVFGNQAKGSDPRFLATQFEIIQSKELLYPVISALGLDKKWGLQGSKEGSFYRLRSMVQMKDVRNTEFIQISVMSTDKVEAMQIANAIAEEYMRKRISEETDWANKGLTQLREEVLGQQVEVTKLKAEMERIRVAENITDLSPDGSEMTTQLESQVLVTIEQRLTEERNRVAALKSRHEQISNMTDEQLMLSLTALEITDPTISTVLPQFQANASEEARMLNSGFGANHPAVKSMRARNAVMNQQLKDQVRVIRQSLSNNLKIAEEGLKSLEARRTAALDVDKTARSNSATYDKAKNEYLKAKKVLDSAEMRLATERVETRMPMNPARIWDYAEVSDVPARPIVWMNIALGGIVGLIFGVGLAFFIEYLDTSVKTMEDVESFLQLPVIAVVPKNMGILMNENEDTPDAEAYRILRTNIEFNRKAADANSITIVSGGAGEGKSTTLANLAYTFAKGGYSTLVVDADLRRPSIHRIFGTNNDAGLTDYLTSEMELEEVVHQSKTDSLYFMTSGRVANDAVGILNSQRMVEFIEEAKSRFDIVFFDSPPILGVSDASVLSSAVDLTLIVVQHRRFPRAMLQRVKQTVTNVGGNILGVILNNVDVRHDQYYEYYTSYYNYYTAPNRKAETKKSTKASSASSQTDSGVSGEY